ncbi:MAG: hypothetical protein OJJ55_06650 [Rhodococcus sp.]|nr:hypothetical protein [Rhodococcus sp. (in: high G+C Gram-positive bacteria)]
MPYLDGPDGVRVWHSNRDTVSLQDPVRKAAEQLADAVETFLYKRDSGVWMKPEFLAHAVSQYDVAKTGSGNYAQLNPEYDHNQWVSEPLPKPGSVRHPELNKNIAVVAPPHAREADHINTEPEPEVGA